MRKAGVRGTGIKGIDIRRTGRKKADSGEKKMFLSLILCAGLLCAGCGSTQQEQEAVSAVLVDAQEAGRGTLVLTNQFVGMVSPEESVYVIPLAQGTVTETFFEVGDEVQAGDVLFQIDDSVARIQLEQAQLSYNSVKQQADSALTTQQDSTNLQLDANLSSAQQSYETLQLQWVKAKDAKEVAEEAVEELEKQIKNYKKQPGFSKEDPVYLKMKEGLEEAKKARTEVRDMFDTLNVNYEAAERTLNTLKATKELTQGAALEDTKEQLNTSLQLAKVGVESAELALSYYQVTTPISGKVISKNVTVNGMATSSSPAYIIAGEDSMTVTFQVSESVMNTLQRGQSIKVERNGEEFEGVITEVGNAVNAQTGLFQIKASVRADGAQLPSGVSVKITSDTYTAENEIIIPYDAVYYETAGSYVYTVKDGRAVKTYVTTGIFDENSIQIVDGISEGDVVITTWSPRLLDGVEVDAKTAEPQTAQNEGGGK
ncbi:MAG: efflux RND transporter periplasmic adaptor subunit [Muribaculum sp.]|nr:efflux RND transporter periplasmic adaptor subunit [Muribaculum sp.]